MVKILIKNEEKGYEKLLKFFSVGMEGKEKKKEVTAVKGNS